MGLSQNRNCGQNPSHNRSEKQLKILLTSSPYCKMKHSSLQMGCGFAPGRRTATKRLFTYTGVLALHRELVQVAVGMSLLDGALDPRLASIRLRDGEGYVHMQHLTIHLCLTALALDLYRTWEE